MDWNDRSVEYATSAAAILPVEQDSIIVESKLALR